jgi:hypothetical protein
MYTSIILTIQKYILKAYLYEFFSPIMTALSLIFGMRLFQHMYLAILSMLLLPLIINTKY